MSNHKLEVETSSGKKVSVNKIGKRYYTEHGEEVYNRDDVSILEAKEYVHGDLSSKKTKAITTDLEKGEEILKKTFENFAKASDDLTKKEKEFSEEVKKTIGKINDAHHRLANSFAKVEKTIDFNKLECRVTLLERAADALERLTVLEEKGKLSAISSALK